MQVNEKDCGKIKEELKTYLPEDYVNETPLEELLDFYNKYVLDWNDAKEKLPKEKQEVLIFSRKEKSKGKYTYEISIGHYVDAFGWYNQLYNRHDDNVLYWKPFPDIPYVLKENH